MHVIKGSFIFWIKINNLYLIIILDYYIFLITKTKLRNVMGIIHLQVK